MTAEQQARDSLGRPIAPLGSKENPILLYEFEIGELRELLWNANQAYESAGTDEAKDTIRSEARARISKRWPMLYDYAHIATRSDPDGRAYFADQFIKRTFRGAASSASR